MTDKTHLPLDRSVALKQPEAVDMKPLLAWLEAQVEDLGDFELFEQFPSGHSNLTYRLKTSTKDLVLRRPPHGAQVKSGHNMEREYRMLRHLSRVTDKVPKVYGYCEDAEVFGAGFFVMERVEGAVIRSKAEASALGPETMARACQTLVETLVEIHSWDLGEAGLQDWGRPEGYVRRQIEGWSKRYEAARTDDIEAAKRVMTWLNEQDLSDGETSLIHNDFKYDNLILNPEDVTEVRAILDWEMATVGDPLLDLGTALAYRADARDSVALQSLPFGPSAVPGNLDRREFFEAYAGKRGQDMSRAVFVYVYGLFKVSVIAQQIYKRFALGLTQDKRFGAMIQAVHLLSEQACRAIEKQRIDDLG